MPETKDGKSVRSQHLQPKANLNSRERNAKRKHFISILKKNTIYENKAKMLRTIKAQFQIAKL